MVLRGVHSVYGTRGKVYTNCNLDYMNVFRVVDLTAGRMAEGTEGKVERTGCGKS